MGEQSKQADRSDLVLIGLKQFLCILCVRRASLLLYKGLFPLRLRVAFRGERQDADSVSISLTTQRNAQL